MASTYLQRTLGTPTSSRIWTFSAWIKRSGISSAQHIFSIDNGSARDAFSFDSDNGLRLYFNSSASPYADLSTNRLLRDTSAWYHLVIAVDTTQSTADDRVKLYINGTQYTWDETTIDPALNYDTFNASGNTFRIGRDRTAAAYFDGLMSHVHFCDGTQLAPTVFGSTDSTTGEWKINTSPSFTLGNNGFTILKDGNTITDQSSNSNNFSLGGGTLTKTEDCPSNNFPTFNNIVPQSSIGNLNLDQGNLYSGGNGANAWRSAFMTLAAKTGKYYCEMKCVGTDGSSQNFGISDVNQFNTRPASSFDFASQSRGYGINPNGNKVNAGGASSAGSNYAQNDIVMMAFDLDNSKIYFGKNGNWFNSGDPTSGATGTGSFFDIATGYFYSPTVAIYGAADNMALNFGNGYIRTAPVSSAGTNASGNGIFEYDVPTGYTALSTKGLNL